MQPSASRTALLLACPRPFDPEVELEPDVAEEPGRYGSAFHQVLAACLRAPEKKPLERSDRYAREVDRATKKYDVRHTSDELAGHVRSSVKVFRNWLKREKLEIVEIETAHAIAPRADGSWRSRMCPPHDDEHNYDVKPGEVPGTVDVVACSANRRRIVVIDHKTGEEDDGTEWTPGAFARPVTIPQLRTLGLVAVEDNLSPANVIPSVEIGIFHADRRGLPNVYAEPYENEDQLKHAAALHLALSLIGKGYTRAGTQCDRCRARLGCGAYTAHLMSDGAALLIRSANTYAMEPIDPKALFVLPAEVEDGIASTEERAGVLYDLLKRFGELERSAIEEIRRLVRAGAIIETRGGKTLAVRTQTYETLSKKSVLDALGPVEGAKEIKRLRKKGVIREATREMLVQEK